MDTNDYISRIIDIPFKVYCGCYLLYFNNELVYVGVSYNIAHRLAQHTLKKNKDWDSVKYIEENDYLKAIYIENYFIDNFSPKYNKAPSKCKGYELSQIDFKNFDMTMIAYPSGWFSKKI